MTNIKLKLPQGSYPILIGHGRLARTAEAMRQNRLQGRAFVVTHPRIRRLHGDVLQKSLQDAGWDQEWLEVPQGESTKCLDQTERLYSRLIRSRAGRGDLVLAFGGGVIGDLAGFVAATYLRGIRLVQIPTTLLAQIDSSIGGKVGVNHRLGKNLIGAFHQPALVLIDPSCLLTLPRRELRAGLMEAVKYGVIADAGLFSYLEKSADPLIRCQPEAMRHVVQACAAIKARVVSEDERESGLRMILNFGHTLGHAWETVTAYRRFKHGEAVGWGMIFAARWACDLGFLSRGDAERLVQLVRRFGLPPLPEMAAGELLAAMRQDKKRSGGSLRWVLPEKIGGVFIHCTDDFSALQEALLRHQMATRP